MKHFIENTLCTISAILLLWLGASVWEVASKNILPNPSYSEWNCINCIVERSI